VVVELVLKMAKVSDRKQVSGLEDGLAWDLVQVLVGLFGQGVRSGRG
jgi:hypothetical protein